jgi:predicted metalloendopeptidase
VLHRTLATATRSVAALALASALASPSFAQLAAAHAAHLSSGIDTTTFDHSVRPQDDFFRYVNGGWLKTAEIPADASSWGAFQELRENSRTALHEIFEEASRARAPQGSARQKVGDLYASYMDSVRVEEAGLEPIKPLLAKVATLESRSDIPTTFAWFARRGVGGPVSVRVGADPKQSSVNIVQMSQSGLGMPDRDYYLKQDAKMASTREAYVAYITKMLELAKQPDPTGAASRILALETEMATPQWDRARSRNRDSTYNRMTVAKLGTLTPSFGWKSYLDAAGLGKAKEVIVRQPDYLVALDRIFASTPVSTWREYLTFHLLDSFADQLPADFGTAQFAFNGRTLSGQEEMAARWKRAVDATNSTLGEAAGALYAKEYFKPEAKARMDALVKNLIEAYRVGIDSLEWMSPATKARAKE